MWKLGTSCAVSFLGTHKSDLVCSADIFLKAYKIQTLLILFLTVFKILELADVDYTVIELVLLV
jgi:hypothetical protein